MSIFYISTLNICKRHAERLLWAKTQLNQHFPLTERQTVYLMAVGGAAYLVSKAIKSTKVIVFNDLGMEAIHEFEVQGYARNGSMALS
jgi:tartrate dehydratase beta subunit/fumarate hydratase class I family protein